MDSRRLHNAAEKESINVHAVLIEPTGDLPNMLYLNDLTFAKTRFETIPIGEFKHELLNSLASNIEAFY